MHPSKNLYSNFVAKLNNMFFVMFFVYLIVVTILCILKDIFTLKSRVDYCTDQKRKVVLQLEQRHCMAVCKRCRGADG
jgi:glycopeptide antibiotics resistance protein